MAKINGNNLGNIMNGTADKDLMHGLSGNDIIHGLSGDDTIYGDLGNDWLYGDSGRDTLFGGDGDDHLFGGLGSDDLVGGRGTNHLWGGGGKSSANIHQDNYYLTQGGQNVDYIHVAKGDSAFQLNALKIPINFDRVYGADKYDKFDLPSHQIMGNAHVNPVPAKDSLFFDAFTIKNGIISLQDHQGKTVKIDSVFLAGEAYKFIIKNCLPINMDKAVAIKVDVTFPPVKYNNYSSYDHNPNPTHTVLLEAHSGPNGGESITAIDILGNLTNTIAYQIV